MDPGDHGLSTIREQQHEEPSELMKICIDYNKCAGMGMCESIADDVFEVGDDAVVHLLKDNVPEDRREEMDEAVDSCPTEAISIQD
jgi:ferredoxin